MTSTLRLANRPSEREFQRAVMELAELCGWETLHVRTSMQQGRYLTATTGTMAKGWPDLVFIHPKRRIVLFVELKGQRGRLTDEQKRVLSVLEAIESVPMYTDWTHETPIRTGIYSALWRPSDWPSIEATLTSSAGLATGKEGVA
jgi:hypothetical protein